MANDLLTGMQVGAQLGNMRAMRQERMLQLRAQQSLQAIRERQLAAQADMLAQHAALYQQQAQQEQADLLASDSVKKAAADQLDYMVNEMGMTQDEAAPQVIQAASLVHPKTGAEMALGWNRLQQGKADVIRAQQAGMPRQLDPSQVALNQARTEALKAGRPEGKGPAAVEEAAVHTRLQDELRAAEAGGNPVEIEKAQRSLRNLETAFNRQHQNPQQTALLGIIKSSIMNIDRQLHSPMASVLMSDEDKAQLLKERTELEAHLKTMGESGNAMEGGAAQEEPKDIGGFKVRRK